MASQKKLTPQQKAAATRKRRREEAERKRLAENAKRRARYAAKKRAASKPKRRTTAKPSRATSSSPKPKPKPAKQKPIATRKPVPENRRKRTPAKRAEAARLGWERRREREAIKDDGSIDTSAWVPVSFDHFSRVTQESAKRKGLSDLRRDENGNILATNGYDGTTKRRVTITKRKPDGTIEVSVRWYDSSKMAGYATPGDFVETYDDLDNPQYTVSFDDDESEAA